MENKRLNQRPQSVVRAIADFYDSNGLLFDWSNIDPDLARAYLVNSTLASSTKGTYRWVLAETLGIDLKDGLSFRGSLALGPYSKDERAELISLARSQNKAWRRYSALSMVALSIGAGCRAGELRKIKGRDLAINASFITIANRVVPIKSPWNQILSSLKPKDDQFLFHPGAPKRDSKNFINNFAYHLSKDPASPRFQMARARSSFICDRWNEAISLTNLLEIAGIYEVESMMRYVHHLDGAPKTKAGLRHLVLDGSP